MLNESGKYEPDEPKKGCAILIIAATITLALIIYLILK